MSVQMVGGMIMMSVGGPMGDFSLVLQNVAKPGSMVKKGDVVAEFDPQNMQQRLDDYKDSVTQGEANFLSMQANTEVQWKAHEQTVAQSKASLDKALLDLKTTPVLSAIAAEQAKLAADEAQARYKQVLTEVPFVETSTKAQLRNSELDLQKTRIEMKLAEANVGKMIVKAPIDGLVVMQQTVRGTDLAQIDAGDQVSGGQPYMSIVDIRSMVVNASVNQADAERLRIGQKARVRFDAYPNLELPATVYSVGGVPKTGGVRTQYLKELPVRLKIDKMDARVIPDLSVSVDVILEAQDQATVAPSAAIFRDGLSSQPYVFVGGPTGWVRRDVELGITNYVAATIRSGLKPGEVVALDRPPVQTAAGENVKN